jgi:drug/metabolite transporter (DMT)-like permease
LFAVQRQRFSPIDALLFLMVLIWGTNYSIVKRAFLEIDPQAFNAVRMAIASSVFLIIIVAIHRMRGGRGAARSSGPDGHGVVSIWHTPAAITSRDWLGLLALGLIGHVGYQYLFVGGLALTTVANSSLLLAATPVVIAVMSALMGQERIGPLHWAGAALSLLGIYVVVGHGMAAGGSLRGDAMMAGAVGCWAIYTLGARYLMVRHSPVGVTGISMSIGTLVYVPLVWSNVRAVNWTAVTTRTWIALVYSALFALCVAYTIWYVAVREIGSARTSVYSNLIPIIAMLTAVLFLGERLTAARIFGAAAVLVGVALTRVGKSTVVIPAEE